MKSALAIGLVMLSATPPAAAAAVIVGSFTAGPAGSEQYYSSGSYPPNVFPVETSTPPPYPPTSTGLTISGTFSILPENFRGQCAIGCSDTARPQPHSAVGSAATFDGVPQTLAFGQDGFASGLRWVGGQTGFARESFDLNLTPDDPALIVVQAHEEGTKGADDGEAYFRQEQTTQVIRTLSISMRGVGDFLGEVLVDGVTAPMPNGLDGCVECFVRLYEVEQEVLTIYREDAAGNITELTTQFLLYRMHVTTAPLVSIRSEVVTDVDEPAGLAVMAAAITFLALAYQRPNLRKSRKSTGPIPREK